MRPANLNLANIALLLLCVAGMTLSGYLWWFKFANASISCGISGGGCDEILTGQYSELFNIPVASWGFFYYGTFALVVFQRLFIKHWLIDTMVVGLLLSGILYSLWLRYLEFFVIHHWCQWCWITVIIIIVATALLVREYWRGDLWIFTHQRKKG